MELQEIERHATALMTAHGVGSLTFAFDNSRSRLGCTHSVVFNKGQRNEYVIPKKITFSRHYAPLLGEGEIRDVILHEIAHALTPGHNHDNVWKATARRIGAKPERCVAPSASPEKSIVATCPCGHVVSKGHRLPRALWVHTGCGLLLTYTRNESIVSFNDMPVTYRQKANVAQQRGLLG